MMSFKLEENEEMDEDGEEDNSEEQFYEHYEYKIVASTRTQNFQCNINEIHFETQNLENPNPGYYIRLETLIDPSLQKQHEINKANQFGARDEAKRKSEANNS
mmetsp:Transcript_42339/g.40590  ORF Transcript_42339/g.40590 Transcript_42339/m.40590 type:complete len:103 (-) Transcript_42339:2724-3032(-)